MNSPHTNQRVTRTPQKHHTPSQPRACTKTTIYSAQHASQPHIPPITPKKRPQRSLIGAPQPKRRPPPTPNTRMNKEFALVPQLRKPMMQVTPAFDLANTLCEPDTAAHQRMAHQRRMATLEEIGISAHTPVQQFVVSHYRLTWYFQGESWQSAVRGMVPIGVRHPWVRIICWRQLLSSQRFGYMIIALAYLPPSPVVRTFTSELWAVWLIEGTLSDGAGGAGGVDGVAPGQHGGGQGEATQY